MENVKFTPEQSLQLIRTMIDRTKQDMSNNGIYFLVWGWLTFLACVGQFILKRLVHYEQHYQVWWLMIIGVAFSIYQSLKQKRSQRVKTYVGESMKFLWIGMGISYFVLSMVITSVGWNTSVFPFFIMLYGLGTFISGCILRFRPLIIGGEFAWGLAIGSAYMEYDYQILCAAAAILGSYIIPAYILRSRRELTTD
jgi:hypothetical protein